MQYWNLILGPCLSQKNADRFKTILFRSRAFIQRNLLDADTIHWADVEARIAPDAVFLVDPVDELILR